MKATELRIGNWVYTGKFSVPRLGIRSNGETKITGEGISYVEQKLLDVKPIPLTEERLLKFGFRIERMKRLDHFRFGKGRLIGHFYKNKRFLFRNVWCNIKYVHSLQNLYFALTNEELKINGQKTN